MEALQAIVAALAREDYEKAGAIAHEDLGFPKHHQAMQREQGATFPPKYQELAMAHHQVAEDLAQVIPSRDMKKILPHLAGRCRPAWPVIRLTSCDWQSDGTAHAWSENRLTLLGPWFAI